MVMVSHISDMNYLRNKNLDRTDDVTNKQVDLIGID